MDWIEQAEALTKEMVATVGVPPAAIKTWHCVTCGGRHSVDEICPFAGYRSSAIPKDCHCWACRDRRAMQFLATEQNRKRLAGRVAAYEFNVEGDTVRAVKTLTITQCTSCGWDTMFGNLCFYCEQLAEIHKTQEKPTKVKRNHPVLPILWRTVLVLIYLYVALWLTVGEWTNPGARAMTAILLLLYTAFYFMRAAQALIDDPRPHARS